VFCRRKNGWTAEKTGSRSQNLDGRKKPPYHQVKKTLKVNTGFVAKRNGKIGEKVCFYEKLLSINFF
jgi:hypothetical protein